MLNLQIFPNPEKHPHHFLPFKTLLIVYQYIKETQAVLA